MPISFETLKACITWAISNYDEFLAITNDAQSLYNRAKALLQTLPISFAADASAALSDDDLTEQLESHFGVVQEGYGAGIDIARVKQVIKWVIENKDLIAALIAMFAKKQ